jgi:hypothetical protein
MQRAVPRRPGLVKNAKQPIETAKVFPTAPRKVAAASKICCHSPNPFSLGNEIGCHNRTEAKDYFPSSYFKDGHF